MGTQLETMERLADHPVVTEADLDYPEHAPAWLELAGARVCTVCGAVSFGPEDSPGAESGTRLPTGVVQGGGPRLDEDAEDFYRQEKWS